MEEEVLEKLITKLIGLTEFGALRWHFAGDVSRAFVTVYKNARLKLTDRMIDITEADGETVRIDPRLHSPTLANLISGLQKAAKESAARFRTGQIQAIPSSSLIGTCKRLLEEDESSLLQTCLVCSRQFDPEKAVGCLSKQGKLSSDKANYICDECVARLGVAVAQSWLVAGARRSEKAVETSVDDDINSDTLSDLLQELPMEAATQETNRVLKKKPEGR
jgi:hypothetical protein